MKTCRSRALPAHPLRLLNNSLRSALLAGTALGLLAGPAYAQTAWTGAVDSDWFEAGNWDNSVPDGATDAVIDTATPDPTVIDGGNATAGDFVSVGYDAIGNLTIQNGGTLSNFSGYVGHNSGSTGVATVTGAGSTWDNGGTLFVGHDGNGSLTIADGGTVTDTGGHVGYNSGSTGTVTVTGAGSTWTNSGTLFVGRNGSGMLTVADGGLITGTWAYLGVNSAGTGTVTVTGAGSAWDNSGSLFVGDAGTGSLTVTDGGTVTNTVGIVGRVPGSSGTVTVSGAGSTWTNSSNLSVGESGTGSLSIADGGVVTNTFGTIGSGPGSSGIVTVTGIGSTWTNSNILYVGEVGTGSLTIADGGLVASDWGRVGFEAGGTGSVVVADVGSTWTISNELNVGVRGTGSLTIANGGAVANTDAYLGDYSTGTGAVTVTGPGSTWDNSGGLFVGNHGSGTLTISNGGAVTNTAGHVGNLAGSSGAVTVTGPGSTWTNSNNLLVGYEGIGMLTIADGGAVTNDWGFVGWASGSIGTVTVTGAGSTWISNGSELVVGAFGTGTLTIADGGVVSPISFVIAQAASSTGTLNIGDGGAAGTLDAATVQFGAGAGIINFNHTDTDYVFGSDVLGTGTINHLAGVTNLTGDSSGFTGVTNVTGGSLYVNGDLGGLVNVTGGTLGGTGTVGGLTIGAGGTLAPGNSIGTLIVADNLTINAGSVYEVELNDGGFVAGINNDLVSVGGTATINGGTVHVRPENGTDDGTTYLPGTYTILTAANGVTGAFGAVTDDFLFLGFSLDYDANNVYLNSFQTDGLADVAQTPNQTAVAEAVDGMGGGAIFDAIVTLTSEEEALAAYDALSGEIHASARTALIEDSRFLREAANARIRAAFGEARPGEGVDFWAHGFGATGSWAGDGNAARLDRSIGGLFIGGDAALTDEIRLGVVAGYSRSGFDVDERASSGAASSYHLGLYGGGQWGDFALRGGAAHSWHSIDVNRQVAFTGFADSLSSSYNARTTQLFGEAGYGFTAAGTKFEPFAGLAHVRLNTDGFAETGGAAALLVEGRSAAVTFSTIGIRAETDVAMGESEAKLRGGLAWRHAFGNVLPVSTHAFASGSDQFTIAGVPVARNVLAVEAGLDMKLTPAATLGLSYSGQFGSGLTDHAAKASFNMRF